MDMIDQCGTTTPQMGALINEIRVAVRQEEDADRRSLEVADRLAPFLGRDGLLTSKQREASDAGYTQHIIHVDEGRDFSVVSLVWLAGQDTPIHDHVAWCVPGVHEGRETEIHYRGIAGAAADPDVPGREPGVEYLVEERETTNRAGDVTALTPPGDIHRVRNPGPDKAISIHVYGADVEDLGSSIRRCYSAPICDMAPT